MLSLLWNFFLIEINQIMVDGAFKNSSVFEIKHNISQKKESILKG